MQSPKLPSNEIQRLAVLSEYDLIDTLPEEDYDNITKLVANICEAPIALITMLDGARNFYKSHYGVQFQESPRDVSFCTHAILHDDPIFIIKDARMDELFIENPFVQGHHAIFYAGVPLINPEGLALGTLCVIDQQPRTLSDSQKEALIILGKQVMTSLELRRKNIKLEAAKTQLSRHNSELKKFASHVSHDLKSPLANIISLTNLLKEQPETDFTPESKEYLEYIEESALILKDYIDGILLHYKADELLTAQRENLQLSTLCEDIQQILFTKNDVLLYHGPDFIRNINKSALTQIIMNLVDNGLKYNDESKRIIKITYLDTAKYHEFAIEDNGIGIEKSKQDLIFQLFTTIPTQNRKPSTGIGLSTIKNLIKKLGGDIQVSSELGEGSTFTFTLSK